MTLKFANVCPPKGKSINDFSAKWTDMTVEFVEGSTIDFYDEDDNLMARMQPEDLIFFLKGLESFNAKR